MRQIVFALLLLCVSSSLNAQSVSKILKNAEKALGGEKAFRAITSVEATGIVTRQNDNATGKFVLRTAKPNQINIAFDVNGFDTETSYNGRSGWTRDTEAGLKTTTGVASLHLQALAAFHNSLWFDRKRVRAKVVANRTAQVNGKLANVVHYTNAKGITIKMFIDQSTRLLVRQEIPFFDTVHTFDFSDHRKVNGVMMPFAMTMNVDGVILDIKFDDIKANVPISSAVFDFPKVSNEPLPDIRTLLTELQANEDKVEGILDTYSYIQKQSSREIGKDGQLKEKESETNQLSFYKGYRIRRLIEKNGKPLNEKEQAKEDEEVQKRVEDIEKQIAKKRKGRGKERPA